MKRRALLLIAALLASAPGVSVAGGSAGLVVSSGGAVAASVVGGLAVILGASRAGRVGGGFASETPFLIVDAAPAEARVLLDGRPLGSAGQLVARAFPVSAGNHVLQVVAEGYAPYAARFTADPAFPTRIRVALVPR